MNKKVAVYLSFLMGFLMIIMTLVGQSNVIKAAPPSKNDVYSNVPDGLKLDKLIDHPDYLGGFTNGTQLITDYPSNILQLLDGTASKQQVASFWGKYDNGTSEPYNYFDLEKKQTISAWIYMGDTYHYYVDKIGSGKDSVYTDLDSNKTADGIALVLQNDANGSKAISGAVRNPITGGYQPASGETLGVWGAATPEQDPVVDKSDSLGSLGLNKSAIQNSFALEFDAVNNFKANFSRDFNGTSGKDDDFDNNTGYKGQHISYGYPGEADTYLQSNTELTHPILLFDKVYAYSNQLKYQAGSSNNIVMTGYQSDSAEDMNVDKAWRHITFKYYPPADGSSSAKISYYFNDLERDGRAKAQSQLNKSQDQTIDISKIKGNTNKTKVRWGFTAATGSQYSAPKDYAVVIQQMPNVASLDSSAKLYDLSQYNTDGDLGREISDLYQDDSYQPDAKNPINGFLKNNKYNVANNDKLKFKYNLDYKSGITETGAITTTIKLPDHVNFTPGVDEDLSKNSIGRVIYSGTGATPANNHEITADEITTDSKGDNVIKLTLDSMETPDQQAIVELYGTASVDKTPQFVEGQPTAYRSNSYIGDVTTPSFIINDELQIDSKNDPQTIANDGSASISGNISYKNGSQFNDSDKTILHTKINGKEVAKGSLSALKDDTKGTYAMILDKSDLKVGANKVQVYVTDSLNRVSNEITYTINLKDSINLLISTNEDEYTIGKNTDVTIRGQLEYDKPIKNVDGDKITLFWNIDGKEFSGKLQANDDKPFVFGQQIDSKELAVGKHTVVVYANDGDRDSNEITYTVYVTDKTLIAKADPGSDIRTVDNNLGFDLLGTYEYSDGSPISDDNGAKVVYSIKNDGMDPQDDVTVRSTDGKIKLRMDPILSLTNEKDYEDVSDMLDDTKSPGLRVGRNEITVTVSDGEYQAQPILYVVNVPDLQAHISSKNLNLRLRSALSLEIPMTYEYSEDNEYQISPGGLRRYYKLNGTESWNNGSNGIHSTSDKTPLDFVDKVVRETTGITTPYDRLFKVDALTIDPYGRKSNAITYNITIITKEMSLNVNDYKFKSINYGKVAQGDQYIDRDGDWDIDVTSYKTNWKLFAEQEEGFSQTSADGAEKIMNASMFYKDKAAISRPLNGNDLIQIATGGDTNDQPLDITDNWGNDDGILLNVNGYDTPGTYHSEITWTLVDSDDLA